MKCSYYNLDALPYLISPIDVHIYEKRLKININVFSYFDDEEKAHHPLHISKNNYQHSANLLYWNEHYAPISSVSKLFSDITKHREPKHFCLRCLQQFSSKDVLMRHQKLCSREDFMSVLHVLPSTDSLDCELRFSAFRNSASEPFVIYADFESILKPIDIVTNATTYYQQHDLCSAAALLVSTIPKIYNTFAIFTEKNALSKFLNQLIK